MAYDGGVITREDIFSREALEVGWEYAKNLEQAINANKDFIESIKEINKIANSFRQVKSTSEYVKIKQEEKRIIEESNVVWKEQDALEKKLISTLKQKELATESTNRELVKQRLELQETNKQIKQEILERTGQIGQYKKLEIALNEVRNQAKNLKAEMFVLEQAGRKNTQAYRDLEIQSKALTLQTNVLDKGIKDIDKSLGQHQREVGNYAIAAEALNPIFGRINSQLGIFGTSVEKLSTTKSPFKELTTDIVQFGKSVGAFLLTPLGAVLTVLGTLFALIGGNKQTVADFNSGLINVGKTTGLADAELTKLGEDIVSLSKKLKVVGTPALMEYATVAGQLGVKGSKNILAFTEALAMLETASNIKGEEGGSDIARLLTLVDGGVQHVKKFGDEIVNLGNNFAATEKEILSNSTSIAQNVTVYKTGRQDILAYGTATKAVGIESELAGSKIGKAMKFLEASIRTGENLTDVMKLTGLSVEELKTQFKDDSGGVLFKFIEGLHEIDKAGGSVIGTLNELGIKEERQERVLSALATGGFETLANAMTVVKDSSGAMTQEFETFSSKLILQWGKMGIAWDNFILSIENGEGIFAQATLSIAEFGTALIEAITPTKQLSDELFDQQMELNGLISKITSSNTTNMERIRLLKELNEKYPELLGNIDLEKVSNDELVSILNKVNENYRERIALQIEVEKADKIRDKRDSITEKSLKQEVLLREKLQKVINENQWKDITVDWSNVEKSGYEVMKRLKDEGKRTGFFSDYSDIEGRVQLVEGLKLAESLVNDELDEQLLKTQDTRKEKKLMSEEELEAYKQATKEAREYYATLDEFGKQKVAKIPTDNATGELSEKENKAAKKAQRDREKLIDEQLKNAKTAYEKQMDLEILKAKRTVEINKDLANDEKRTMEERMLSFETYSKESFNLKQKEAEKEFTLASNFNKDQKALTNEEIQNYLEGNVSIENLTHEQQLVLEKWYDVKNALRKKEAAELEAHVKKEAEIILKRSLTSLDISENKDLEKLNAKYAEDLRLFVGNETEKKKLTEQFEADKRKIQNDHAKKRIDEEIQNAEKLIALTEADDDKKRQLLNDFQKFKTRLSEIELEEQKELLDKKLEKEKEYHQKLKDISRDLYRAIGDFVNVLFDARVQRIDDDIDKTNKKYEQEFQLAQGNEKEQARIRLRQQADVDKLEEKKRKERQRQAIFNKAMAAMEIGISTAVAIIGAWKNPGFPAAIPLTALIGALGAVQLATVLATPIPKYEFGTRGKKHKGGIAEVGEKRPEVVLEPGRDPYIINKRGYYDLPKGTEVIPSLDEYKRLQRTTMMMSLVNEKQDLDTYQMNMVFDSAYGAEIVQKLDELKKQKQNIIVKHSTRIDVGHDFWKFSNLKTRN
ncbi:MULTISPECIES: phage tail tape measure protein [unclassified Myroides]|uniref:phage tail tape measure protein n=1 Tax=unclassified Myroides TaxID=2642485 RepID=UPI003D2F6AFC